MKSEAVAEEDPNIYMNYIEPLLPEVEKIKGGNKVKYTIHFHRPVFNEELFELYKKYHLAIY